MSSVPAAMIQKQVGYIRTMKFWMSPIKLDPNNAAVWTNKSNALKIIGRPRPEKQQFELQ
jgi:hypothetical protein